MRATDTSELDSDTGTLSASGLARPAGSFGANIMSNTVEAFIDGAIGDHGMSATSTSPPRRTTTSSAAALGLSVAGLVAGVGTSP